MEHYCRGDAKKITRSSEDEEGYENYPFFIRSIQMMSQLNLSDKRVFIFGNIGEAPPLPAPPVSDDNDRQFWAEDELSCPESRQQLRIRRKRRHSLSYRNRIALQSRSQLFESSSSSEPKDSCSLAGEKRERFSIPRKMKKCETKDNASSSTTSSSERTIDGSFLNSETNSYTRIYSVNCQGSSKKTQRNVKKNRIKIMKPRK